MWVCFQSLGLSSFLDEVNIIPQIHLFRMACGFGFYSNTHPFRRCFTRLEISHSFKSEAVGRQRCMNSYNTKTTEREALRVVRQFCSCGRSFRGEKVVPRFAQLCDTLDICSPTLLSFIYTHLRNIVRNMVSTPLLEACLANRTHGAPCLLFQWR